MALIPTKWDGTDDPSVPLRQWQQIATPLPSSSFDVELEKFPKIFTYEELREATSNFSEANFLGKGGFGPVHKGVLSDGKTVAIKQLEAESNQGEREFQAEVKTITGIHHKHLVQLVGYCSLRDQRLLVYEFLPNKSLEYHLHGEDRPILSWQNRFKIAKGVAIGLAYLHEYCNPKIIHRDIKSANILLDGSFEAKVADFGLARFSYDTKTHVSTLVKGTFGYMDPEYLASGNKLTEKSDVYSFGILLMELITGRRPMDNIHSSVGDNLALRAKTLLTQALQDGNFYFVDRKLQEEYNKSELSRMVACAAACVCHSAMHRPQMSQISRALEGDLRLNHLTDGITTEPNSKQDKESMEIFLKMAQANGQNKVSSSFADCN